MQQPIVSIIVPVYKVERYLCRCVDSILNQTYKDIEVILVDDGSPDACPTICDEYARRDSRVRVIHKKNGGLSSARNAGLDSSSMGYYVTFVDSDDWIENNTVEYCVYLLNSYQAGAVEFECDETRDYKEHSKQAKERIDVYEGDDVLKEYLRREAYSVCMGMYETTLFDGFRFREGKINEDIDFKYKVLQRCDRMVYTNQKKYFYFQAGNSISMGGLKSKDFDLYEAADELFKLTQESDNKEVRFLGDAKRRRTAFSLLCKIAYYGVADPELNKKELIKQLTSEHRKNTSVLLRSSMSLSRKILAVLFYVDYYITEFIIRIVRPFVIY
jgi:glycosyltransferase involved in cell wall biosynthesis